MEAEIVGIATPSDLGVHLPRRPHEKQPYEVELDTTTPEHCDRVIDENWYIGPAYDLLKSQFSDSLPVIFKNKIDPQNMPISKEFEFILERMSNTFVDDVLRSYFTMGIVPIMFRKWLVGEKKPELTIKDLIEKERKKFISEKRKVYFEPFVPKLQGTWTTYIDARSGVQRYTFWKTDMSVPDRRVFVVDGFGHNPDPRTGAWRAPLVSVLVDHQAWLILSNNMILQDTKRNTTVALTEKIPPKPKKFPGELDDDDDDDEYNIVSFSHARALVAEANATIFKNQSRIMQKLNNLQRMGYNADTLYHQLRCGELINPAPGDEDSDDYGIKKRTLNPNERAHIVQYPKSRNDIPALEKMYASRFCKKMGTTVDQLGDSGARALGGAILVTDKYRRYVTDKQKVVNRTFTTCIRIIQSNSFDGPYYGAFNVIPYATNEAIYAATDRGVISVIERNTMVRSKFGLPAKMPLEDENEDKDEDEENKSERKRKRLTNETQLKKEIVDTASISKRRRIEKLEKEK